MFCTNCGAKLPDGARFCTSCGAPVESADANPAPIADPASAEAAPKAAETSENAAEEPVGAASVDDPGETVVTLDAAYQKESAAIAEQEDVQNDPGETVVTLDATDPDATADAGEPQTEQTDPGETVVTLDAVDAADDTTAEHQDAADSEPAENLGKDPTTDEADATANDAVDAVDSPAAVEDAAEAVDPTEAETIFEKDDNAAVAVDFPDDEPDDPTTLAESVSDGATTLFGASDDATTVVPFDEDAEATAAAMESLGVSTPTAGDTVVENPIDMNAYAAQAAPAQPAQAQAQPHVQVPADMTMAQPPIAQQQPPVAPTPARTPQQKKRRWPIVAGLGLVAAGAAVAAIMFLAPNANAVEVTSGSQDAVVCTVDTKVLPKKKDRVIHSYTATLIPKSGGKSYKIKVKGDDGFTIGDFGKVKPGNYRCVIETPKGETVQHFNTTVVKKDDTAKNGDKPVKDITVKGDSSDDDSATAGDDTTSSNTTTTDDATTDDDSTSSDDTGSSSTSSGSHSSSSSNGSGSTSSSSSNSNTTEDTTAPATIDDATYKAACTAYKTKVKELSRTYGKPTLSSTGSGSDYQIGGLQMAQLVDFNGDGLEELVTVHSKTKASKFNKKTRLKNGDYVLDVWGYNGKKLVNLYSGSPQGSNGGYVFVTIEKMNGGDSEGSNKLYLAQHISNGSAVLASGKKSSDSVDCKYFTYDGKQFSALEDENVHGDSFDDQSAFLIKGYKDNLEDQDTSAPENHIDTSKLNLNDTVKTVEDTLTTLDTKITGTDSGSDSSSSSSTSSKSKSKKSRKSTRSSSSSSSSSPSSSSDDDDDYSYDDDDDYSYDDDGSYDSDSDDSYDSSDDSDSDSSNDSSSDSDRDSDDDDTDSYAARSSQPVEFTDWYD